MGEMLCLKKHAVLMEVYNEGFEDWTILQQQEEVSQHEVLLGARFFSISPASRRGKLLAANICG